MNPEEMESMDVRKTIKTMNEENATNASKERAMSIPWSMSKLTFSELEMDLLKSLLYENGVSEWWGIFFMVLPREGLSSPTLMSL